MSTSMLVRWGTCIETGTSTTILIRFDEKVMARERRSERG